MHFPSHFHKRFLGNRLNLLNNSYIYSTCSFLLDEKNFRINKRKLQTRNKKKLKKKLNCQISKKRRKKEFHLLNLNKEWKGQIWLKIGTFLPLIRYFCCTSKHTKIRSKVLQQKKKKLACTSSHKIVHISQPRQNSILCFVHD